MYLFKNKSIDPSQKQNKFRKGRNSCNFQFLLPSRVRYHFLFFIFEICTCTQTIIYTTSPVTQRLAESDSRIFVTAMADEEPVDQKKHLEEFCKPKCVKPLVEYQACIKRIQGDTNGEKHCTGQYLDYWQCVDKCVAPKLFMELK
ncbi:Cytochrome b-c1 complex subunit 6-like protein [Heracleum sosnowskyi]|uniref:Complex III subunit VI n=1 Tax=Heracleum sosnowskyi TaxID=360622 RepID=A0AAD8NCF7_9APIA|nr:Cytochrome b-c1 complex subunit 6-like protein [Heracleum sosnowskyi]